MLDNCGKTFIKCPIIWTFKGPKHFNLKEFSFLFFSFFNLSILIHACNFYLNHAYTCNKIRAIQSKPRPDESTRPRVIWTGTHLIQEVWQSMVGMCLQHPTSASQIAGFIGWDLSGPIWAKTSLFSPSFPHRNKSSEISPISCGDLNKPSEISIKSGKDLNIYKLFCTKAL